MLLTYGNTVCSPDWRIDEKIPAGYCRVYYVLGGIVRYDDDQRQTLLKSGHLYLFPSATPYRMWQNAADPLRCTFIHIDIFPSLATELIECPVEDGTTLKHILEALSCAIDDGDQMLIYALSEVLERYAAGRGLIAPPTHALAKVLTYIAGHIGEDIAIGRLSAMAGYHEQYFIRLFRRKIGLTPYQYIISHRLKTAKEMLLQGESVSRAAELTGYRDGKAFSRAFKQGVGMTPSSFRKNSSILP